jgi:hypothetical protein
MRSISFEGDTWQRYEELRTENKPLHQTLCRISTHPKVFAYFCAPNHMIYMDSWFLKFWSGTYASIALARLAGET